MSPLRFAAPFIAVTLALGTAPGPAQSADLDPPLTRTVLAAATPDECFGGIGVDYAPLQTAPDGSVSCPDGQRLKVNQAYVWGMAKSGSALWFGTGPNIHCLASGQYLDPIELTTESYVCEGPAASHLRTPFFTDLKTELVGKGATPEQADDLIRRLGDWRAPNLFTYDLGSHALVKIDDQVTGDGARLLARTVGIRSAGAVGDTVLFAGPDIASFPNGGFGAVNFFVFKNGRYLGAESVSGWTNIRKWVEVDGALYTGVATVPEPGSTVGGKVLRFLGSDPTDVVRTEVVGRMTTAPSDFTEHGDRIYTSTWPVGVDGDPAAIWVSPPLGGTGLTAGDADGWREVWNIRDYEPDPLVASSTAIGPVESHDGALFWGTMNIPFVGAFQHGAEYFDRYGHRPATSEIAAMLIGGHRATSVFRARALDTDNPQVDLLYGSARLPVASYADSEPHHGSPVTWTARQNRMSAVPLYGPAGFGNPFNAYTWTMSVNRGELYVGTFDQSYLISSLLRELLAGARPSGMVEPAALQAMLREFELPADGSDLPWQYGADLYKFTDSTSRADEVFIDGGGNRYSYGIRTIVEDDENGLYLGMANPMNLEVNPTGDPQGGWQLLQVAPRATSTTLTASANPVAEGTVVRLRARVTAPDGTPTGSITVFDGNEEVGRCPITRFSSACPVILFGLASGTHRLTARYSGQHAWAASASQVLSLQVTGPTPAPVPAPTTTPTPGPGPLSVKARSASRFVVAKRTTVLVRSAPKGKVAVRCTLRGGQRTGKAARTACGISVTTRNPMQIWAKPTCRAARVAVSFRMDGTLWQRSWQVSRRFC